MGDRLKVMRKRRARSLQSKIIEYAHLFNLNVTLVAQDKTNGDYEIFQPKLNKSFPPARNDINPRILHVGREVKARSNKSETKLGNDLHSKLRRIEKLISQSEVPKPPKVQGSGF
ncbi:hypothetical protein GGR58DRAFT_514374 [Xylaria digitata]|nr:hypothetical protein GGR58DRAFT_514374 [Xylaria digitata]